MMLATATAVENLRACRLALRVSQSRLARLSCVSRFKICSYELGDRSLTTGEQLRISEALQAEAERLRNLSIQIDFGQPRPTAARR
jgi:transcriptional regulator with XRE-family HTH domain